MRPGFLFVFFTEEGWPTGSELYWAAAGATRSEPLRRPPKRPALHDAACSELFVVPNIFSWLLSAALRYSSWDRCEDWKSGIEHCRPSEAVCMGLGTGVACCKANRQEENCPAFSP